MLRNPSLHLSHYPFVQDSYSWSIRREIPQGFFLGIDVTGAHQIILIVWQDKPPEHIVGSHSQSSCGQVERKTSPGQ